MLTRRRVLTLAAAQALAVPMAGLIGTSPANAGEVETHGLSAFGDLKYPKDFKHFDYVNPAAPKGGVYSSTVGQWITNQTPNTFNSLNVWILKGEGAAGVETTFATLMVRALDEPDAVYGLAAESVRVSADRLTYRFRLRDGITFHDGTPITAEDVAWSFQTLKAKGHPTISQTLRDMAGVAADGRDVVVTFAPTRSRDLHLIVAGLPIFSKAYYSTREFDQTTMEPPLGSGGYRVGRFEQGRYIEYERVRDWWGATLPTEIGTGNFDVVRIEFFRDRNIAFEAFKAGDYLVREEFTSRIWATQYDFPAIADGRVKRVVLEDRTPSGAQGWFINTRRPKFQDTRVREALTYAFDFEWTNRTIMFGLRARTASYFQNSDMMAVGAPTGGELALLEPHRAKLPAEVFGEPWVPPVSDGTGSDRRMLQTADRLFREAGFTRKDGKLIAPNGEPFAIEFLDFEPGLEPHTNGFIQNLSRLGITAGIRRVDPAQYESRLDEFDFDMTVQRYSLGATPGEAAKLFWTSEAARTKGSKNLAGIADPVVDALIEKLVNAPTRNDLTTACRALDRVLRAGRYWVPQWFSGEHWFATWDVYGRPAEKPRYARGAPDTWWIDAPKAAALGKGLRV
jgi:microcin C transport system substrate-binding protein